MRFFATTMLCLFGVMIGGVSAEPFEDIVTFGASFTDTGNVFAGTTGTFPPSPPYFNGRFSNGPIWIEYLADMLGKKAITPGPSLQGGTAFGWGGAETGTGMSTLNPLAVNINAQISSDGTTPFPGYLDIVGGKIEKPSKHLFIIWGGANDFLGPLQGTPEVAAANIAQGVQRLAEAGAWRILVANLPDLGLTPAALGTANSHPLFPVYAPAVAAGVTGPQLTMTTSAFNAALETELQTLESQTLPRQGIHNTKIRRLDVAGLFDEVLADPTSFGFTNTTDPVWSGLGFVGDPDEFLFWDPVHPTTRAHAIIAAGALRSLTGTRPAPLRAIPEPASCLVLVCGVIFLAASRLRRS